MSTWHSVSQDDRYKVAHIWNRGRSLTFSSDRLLSLYLTFLDLFQYPRILKIF